MEDGAEALDSPVETYDLQAEKERWSREFGSAKKWLEAWKKQAERIDGILRDEREHRDSEESRWALFPANVETKKSMLYGRPPRVSVERRYQDEADDVARVAGDIASRFLNTDIERTSDGYRSALGYALSDRLEGGWGLARARYEVEWEDVPEKAAVVDPVSGQELAPKVPAGKRKTSEEIETDYIHWQDQMWSPCRHFHEMRWWSQKAQMTKAEVAKKWGDDVANAIPYDGKPPVKGEHDTKMAGDWGRADVWEIWDKERKLVCWYVENYGAIECKPDPYELDGFFPFPRPMVANATTSKYLPRPDYALGQDQYTEVNIVTSRIRKLITAVRVSGVYAKEHPEIAQMLEAIGDGNLIGSENWGALAEKGGLRGAVDWFPVEAIVAAILQLRDYRRELVDMIGQETGQADIMRGEATVAGTTATENRVKSRMGSVRMQATQDEFARFASDLQNIRMQLASKFMDAKTIGQRAGVEFMKKDAQFIGPALALLKSPQVSQFRIEVKSEAVSLTDMAALKAERMEALTALAGAMSALVPVAQQIPQAQTLILEAGQWAIAGMRGSGSLEASFDAAVDAAQKAAAQPQQAPPDPKLEAERMKLQGTQMKIQGDSQKEQQKHQNKLVEIQAETAAHDQQEQSQATWNVREQAQKAAIQHAFKPAETHKPGGVQ
jgi:hypothetical protein